MNTALNLDDITHCPLGDRCAHCGSTRDLAVATFDTPIGVLCRTICGTCAADHAPRNPFRFSLELNQMVRTVCDHCEHLGIDLDQMAAVLDTEHGCDHGSVADHITFFDPDLRTERNQDGDHEQ